MTKNDPGACSVRLNRLIEIVVILCCTALVVTGGLFALWRMDQQATVIGEIRAALMRADDVLRQHVEKAKVIEKNQRLILERLKK